MTNDAPRRQPLDHAAPLLVVLLFSLYCILQEAPAKWVSTVNWPVVSDLQIGTGRKTTILVVGTPKTLDTATTPTEVNTIQISTAAQGVSETKQINVHAALADSIASEGFKVFIEEDDTYDTRNIQMLVSKNQGIADQLTRAWQPWNASSTGGDKFGWCVTNDNVTGLFFTKIPKAASTTGASITFQIAHNVYERHLANEPSNDEEESEQVLDAATRKAMRRMTKKGAKKRKTTRKFQKDNTCNNWHFHGTKYTRRQDPYLAWTSIRDPAKRAISQCWFRYVTRRQEEATDDLVIEFLDTLKSYQLNYLTRLRKVPKSGIKPKPRHNLSDGSSVNPIVYAMDMIDVDLMSVYHFIAIAERMSESLVAFKLLYGLEYRDIIVLSSKQAGGYDDGEYKDRCNKIQPAVISPRVADYLKNNFTVFNYDYLLYEVANKSLDLTIDMLGRDLVEAEVKEFDRLQAIAEDLCMKEAIFPCSPNGTLQREAAKESCFSNDQGCGHKCVQRVLSELEGHSTGAGVR